MVTDLVDPLASVRSYLAAEKSDNTRRIAINRNADEPDNVPTGPGASADLRTWKLD